MKAISEKQKEFITKLLEEATPEAKEKASFLIDLGIENLTVKEASYCINILLKNQKGESTEKPKTKKVEYFKNLLDYITIEEYKDFLKEYAKENLFKSWNYQHTAYKTNKEALENYEKELFDNLKNDSKYDWFGELRYIREAIIHKSLGLTLDDRFSTNGESKYYKAIWNKLPTIEGLEITSEAYSASWGYDQTNIDIAYRLNKKVWGLDILKDNDGNYYLVRMKDTTKPQNYFAFSDKNGVRNFRRDLKPLETFKQDASQTGYYR